MLVLKLLVLLNLHVVLGENCSSATSCSECILLDEACYWCSALATEKSISGCLRFNIDKIAKLLCPSKWVHNKNMCSEDENIDNIDLVKLSELSRINYKNKLSELANNYFNGDDYVPHSVEEDTSNRFQVSRSESKGSQLKNLLHKLLILKLLRKIKNKESGLTEEEKNLLYELSDKTSLPTEPTTTTTTTTTTMTTTTMTTEPVRKTDELSELLRILRNEAERRLRGANDVQQLESEHVVDNKNIDNLAKNKLKNEFKSVDVKTTVKQILQEEKVTIVPTALILNSKPNNISLSTGKQNTGNNEKSPVIKTTKINIITGHNHVEKVDVKYEEQSEETLEEWVKKKIPSKHFNTSLKPTIKTMLKTTTSTAFRSTTHKNEITYCKLFEENDLCNSDHNCTWCNTLDICIQRNNDDYKTCVRNVEQMVDEQYGLDRCFKAKHCKQCVQDDKCYWCDMSQRCHTYPFFGYVPNSCGGDWYVKQCDVQLAVIIVVLPLIIILLGMVTFYFCLKYCHYRQKVLRVPLFEKPGIFDYRKDKKVYFVNPEDESSDDELAKEKMRKKYRLPIEKEPLIDPNT